MTQIKEPTAPATDPQINYLTSLIKDRDLPEVCEKVQLGLTLQVLTKGAASEFITQLLAAPKKAKPAVTAAKVVEYAPLAQQVQEIATTAAIEAAPFGYYEIDGDLYHWDVTGKDHKPTLRKLYVTTSYSGVKKGSWKKAYGGAGSVKVEMTYVPYNGKGYQKAAQTSQIWVPGIIAKAIAAGAQPISQAKAAELGKAYTFCIRCGATLTDPQSVADGIGPVCKTYWY